MKANTKCVAYSLCYYSQTAAEANDSISISLLAFGLFAALQVQNGTPYPIMPAACCVISVVCLCCLQVVWDKWYFILIDDKIS